MGSEVSDALWRRAGLWGTHRSCVAVVNAGVASRMNSSDCRYFLWDYVPILLPIIGIM